MRAGLGSFATVVCAFAALGAGAALGQNFVFQDDFNRDAWDNGQTNAFLPAWSAPGGSFTPPIDGTPIQAQVVVAGTQFRVLINGTEFVNMSDPDLKPGSVGLHAWYQHLQLAGQPRWGLRCESLNVQNAQSQTILQENWVLPFAGPWVTIRPKHANGVVEDLTNARGNFKWEFTRGSIGDDTNNNENSTTALRTDFLGSQVGFAGAGAFQWSDYKFRTRLFTTDNDGLGVIFRYFEDANTLSFYRVTFAAENNTNANGLRPGRGISIQKLVQDKNSEAADAAQWTSLHQDPDASATPADHIYTPGTPFDVTVTVQNISDTQTKIDVSFLPVGGSEVIVSVTDSSDPIKTGSIGFFNWGSDPTKFLSYGGVSTPVVETLDAVPVTLLGDIFKTPASSPTESVDNYNGWTSPFQVGIGTGRVAAAGWGIHLETGDLMEASDGRVAESAGGDGQYKPYILYKNGFNSGTDYTFNALLRSYDNDGFGLVFGYVDGDNYFRLGLRAQSPSNLGFPTGVSVDKVVGGTITQLEVVASNPNRSNQAGLWIKKFATGALEQVAPANLADASGQDGVEFQGPRLVAGNVDWTDYTFEYVTEVRDDWGIGPVFRYQDELNYYRLTFSGQDFRPTGPPIGLSLQKVVNGVYTELFKDTDPTQSGDNDVNPAAGFIYEDVQSTLGFRIWRTRVILNGGTIKIEIDGILEDGTEVPNYYMATIADPAPLTHGKIGFHTWAQTANELRDISVTLAGQTDPVLVDGDGTPDPKGWEDVTIPTLASSTNAFGGQGGTGGVAAGAPISGFGIRPDINAIGVRDNRYVGGTGQNAGDLARGTVNFEGPRAVVGEINWKDYTYKVDLRNLDDDGIGIIFRYQNEDNFYRLMFMSQGNNNLGPPPQGVSVQKRRNGVFSELYWSGSDAGNHFIYRVGETWNVELTAQGSDFTVKVTQMSDYDGDGKTEYTMNFSDPADPLLTGRVGVTVWGSNGQANEGNALLQPGGLPWTQYFSESGVFDNVVVEGTYGRLPPDLDANGVIDGNDYILWEACVTGPEVPYDEPTPACRRADVDNDGDVDQEDFAYFQRCFTGTLGGPIVQTCVD